MSKMLRLSDKEHEEQVIKREDLWIPFNEKIKPLEDLGNDMVIKKGIRLTQKVIQRLRHIRFETNFYTSNEDRLKVGMSIAEGVEKALKAHQALYDLGYHDRITISEKDRGKKVFNSDNDWGSDNLSNITI